jgi:ABC-2 type transport system permease protein
MREELRELWRYRELLLMFVQRDLKVRYKNSVLGFGWSLINPLVQVLTIAFVIQFLMGSRVENYHAYLFCATVPWFFFNSGLLDSGQCLVFYYHLLRKTYFPREIMPLATVGANLVHFVLATTVFLVYMVVNALFWGAAGGKLQWPLLASTPLIVIPMLGLALLVAGLSFFISVWTLYYEDVRFLLDSLLKILYWMVPVVYFPDLILTNVGSPSTGRLLYHLYMLNPVASFITSFRKLALLPTRMPGQSFVTPEMQPAEWLHLGIAFAVSLLVFAAGYHYFCSRKWRLAERG